MQFLIFMPNSCDVYDERFDISNFWERFVSVEKVYLTQSKLLLIQTEAWCPGDVNPANTHSASELE